MKIRNSIIFIFVVSLLGCSESSPIESQLDSSINGKTVSYSINQKFNICLDVVATAGYEWQCLIQDSSIVHVDSIHYTPKNNANLDGGVTIETIYLRTTKVGQSLVLLFNRRPWETNVAPVDSLKFIVVVH